MAEYYDWVNIDKNEYLSPDDFGYSPRAFGSHSPDCNFLGALYELISTNWKGDRIVYLGDETTVPDDVDAEAPEWISDAYLREKIGKWIKADIAEDYRNVSCLFKAASDAREEFRQIIRDGFESDYYHMDRNDPYKGMFIREPAFFRYTVNLTRKEYFDLEITEFQECFIPRRKKWEKEKEPVYSFFDFNPLLILLGYGKKINLCREAGRWIGDRIEVTDEIPPEGYRDISKAFVWGYK